MVLGPLVLSRVVLLLAAVLEAVLHLAVPPPVVDLVVLEMDLPVLSLRVDLRVGTAMAMVGTTVVMVSVLRALYRLVAPGLAVRLTALSEVSAVLVVMASKVSLRAMAITASVPPPLLALHLASHLVLLAVASVASRASAVPRSPPLPDLLSQVPRDRGRIRASSASTLVRFVLSRSEVLLDVRTRLWHSRCPL